ncbi:MAG TPA: hypothetical protein VN634_00400 [Candidatus Limnocylindrales bacterium]|nr:hypothetical protein [Candidatus Limnocylindrales bacterium]
MVVPAEIAARRYAFRGRLMIRAAAWGVLCTAIAGPSFFVFTGKNLAALAAAAGLSCWLLAKLDLPSFAGERLDSFILRARTRAGDPILLAALCALGIAAVAGAALTARSPAADLTTLLNSTSTPISDVELKLGKTIVRFGDIPIGGRRYVPLWRPSNLEDYEIRWREPSGAPQTVKFRGRLKGPPNMDLRFEILSDRVRILDGEYPMIGDNEILVTRE